MVKKRMAGISTLSLWKCFWLSPFTSTSWAMNKYPLYVFKFPRSPETNTKHCWAFTLSLVPPCPSSPHTKLPACRGKGEHTQEIPSDKMWLCSPFHSPLSATWANSWSLCFRDFQRSYWRHCHTRKCILSCGYTMGTASGVASSAHRDFHLALS